ncbi:8-oxo-dGDP phosphatase NUDT18 [Oopsacas minuta]|uniref:8-oxo-dGDP phosphatase NUDT18 n=1 Tax=Oopsacas minuta TaxID=111878 RepID=A0AAV7JCL8_9METZ|nr:8-oxo-dGDP phosphatase NUDT18 [Oopsacas minuta]
MQEAKESCRGTWYLPAGRMELGETIEQGCMREVLEETGLQVQPVSLVMVEAGGGRWLRFTFYCNVIGGELKSKDKADKESIQAGWFDLKSYSITQNMRMWDVIPLIDCTQKWLMNKNKLEYLPGVLPYKFFIVRLICVNRQEGVTQVLLNDNKSLPVIQVPTAGKVRHHVCEKVRDILKDKKAEPKVIGVAGVDHTGGDRDGICITLVVILEITVPHSFWYPVVEDMKSKVDRFISRAIPLDIYCD